MSISKLYKIVDVHKSDAHSGYKGSLIGKIMRGETEESAIENDEGFVAGGFYTTEEFKIDRVDETVEEGDWFFFLGVKVEEVDDES